MNLEKQTPIDKQNPPIWLKVLVIFLVGLGIFFRFSHLGQKAIWYDEAFTSLAISGHTVAEVQQEVLNEGIIPVAALDKYQHLNPDRGVNDTVRYLITSDPQHPPLYYTVVRLWAQVFGDSAAGVRSLSAVISLLIFPSVYWLCLELFESTVVGWVAIALMAVSPMQIFLAQDARQYGLWMVTILVCSAALLRTLRRETFLNWAIYALALTVGLYTHLFTALVAMAHGIYVASQQRFRFNKTLANYLLATTVGLFIFLAWIFVFITHISTAKQLTSHLSLYKLDNPFDLIAILLAQITRIFFDINFSSYTPLVNKSFWEIEHIYYSVIAGIFSLILILYILYFIVKERLNRFSLFLILLGAIPSICLLLPDMILGGTRSTIFRYQLPLYVSLQIAVAYVLGVYIFSQKHWQQKIWQCLMVGFLLAGLVSDVIFFKADTWWLQIGNQYPLATAKYINKFENTLLLSSNQISNIGSLLILNHLLNSKINLLIVQDDHLPLFPKEASNIFLFDSDMTNSQNLLTRFKKDKTYSLRLIDEPLTELWQVEKKS
ncbi:MAG: glycosyltransferase family 39 protein [Nostoc sp. ChiQUE02]|uniref:glycosyltransferase family 39 protein n=1 Tax=Nostoc sp. ChiQUE02 TaxID=3075377 RepID=UPI002AD553B9|nr:glycosyltransferase family 39 protein [Nostoc sp. ChiQUE02]MDZ8234081.1 glycosyltransferase family 39 protein [Nostoc sp. ChiQUE02]